MLAWGRGGMVAVSAYMGGIRGSGVLSSAGDLLEMSVVRVVCGVCDMCMCLARGGVGGVGDDWVWEDGARCCEPGLFVLIAGPGICILC